MRRFDSYQAHHLNRKYDFEFYHDFIIRNDNFINKIFNDSAEIIRAFCFYGSIINVAALIFIKTTTFIIEPHLL